MAFTSFRDTQTHSRTDTPENATPPAPTDFAGRGIKRDVKHQPVSTCIHHVCEHDYSSTGLPCWCFCKHIEIQSCCQQYVPPVDQLARQRPASPSGRHDSSVSSVPGDHRSRSERRDGCAVQRGPLGRRSRSVAAAAHCAGDQTQSQNDLRCCTQISTRSRRLPDTPADNLIQHYVVLVCGNAIASGVFGILARGR